MAAERTLNKRNICIAAKSQYLLFCLPTQYSYRQTLSYPGFPTDMQPQITVALALSRGTSIVTESIFENRFKYVDVYYGGITLHLDVRAHSRQLVHIFKPVFKNALRHDSSASGALQACTGPIMRLYRTRLKRAPLCLRRQLPRGISRSRM